MKIYDMLQTLNYNNLLKHLETMVLIQNKILSKSNILILQTYHLFKIGYNKLEVAIIGLIALKSLSPSVQYLKPVTQIYHPKLTKLKQSTNSQLVNANMTLRQKYINNLCAIFLSFITMECMPIIKSINTMYCISLKVNVVFYLAS